MAQTISTLGTAYLMIMTSIGKIGEISKNFIGNLNEDDFSCLNVAGRLVINNNDDDCH